MCTRQTEHVSDTAHVGLSASDADRARAFFQSGPGHAARGRRGADHRRRPAQQARRLHSVQDGPHPGDATVSCIFFWTCRNNARKAEFFPVLTDGAKRDRVCLCRNSIGRAQWGGGGNCTESFESGTLSPTLASAVSQALNMPATAGISCT